MDYSLSPLDGDLDLVLLSIRFALEDIHQLQTAYPGKARAETVLPDEQLALECQAENLRLLLSSLEDRRIALSFHQAITADSALIENLARLDRVQVDDHNAAQALERNQPLPTLTDDQKWVEGGLVPINPFKVKKFDSSVQVDASISFNVTTSTSPPIASSSRATECIICGDRINRKDFHAECGHAYCRSCLVDLVRASTQDETLFPVRCCRQDLPMSRFLSYIPLGLQAQFEIKSREFSTSASDRLYCVNPTCSEFLGSSHSEQERQVITCSECGTNVCSGCKASPHGDDGRTENADLLVLKELAREHQWQTCPGCNSIVELQQGCNHITCRCGSHFCYLCAARWKTCRCAQWDEHRIILDAERRVRNEFGEEAAIVAPDVHAQRVQHRVEEIRYNHDCDDHSWTYRHGGGRCEQCRDRLPLFMMRCLNCQTLACRRCAYNRRW